MGPTFLLRGLAQIRRLVTDHFGLIPLADGFLTCTHAAVMKPST